MKHFWILFFLLPLAGCKKGGGPPKDAPVPVELVAVEVGPLLETLRATGTLEAEEAVDLKPEVDGEVTSIRMTEGEVVKKGDLILQIDES
ncbi:efflux RND transporter periplasmic adaptor subunit, partial [bacterium]|nr:efflux RND transporter periplasmic adaptor subunit [bacterium]